MRGTLGRLTSVCTRLPMCVAGSIRCLGDLSSLLKLFEGLLPYLQGWTRTRGTYVRIVRSVRHVVQYLPTYMGRS